ncbi:MAG: TIM barrel protein [Candidatus Nanoarchaeia archaeon]|nr:TIM barrel protein [Candidatus Nanoarchaeia archaeon]MDD5239582.1 TIM barrel protein [Candidatus Nanoarchaeia archaeon]
MKLWLGPAGTPIDSKSSLSAITDLAGLGLNAMELQFTYGVKMGIETARRIGELAKQGGIRLSIHAPYYINLLQQDKAKLNRSLSNIYESAKRADLLGAKVVVFHPGAYMKMQKGAAMEQMISVCEEASKNVSVPLGLELTGKQGQFGNIDEIVAVCKAVKGCVPVVDFAHDYARNAGHIDYDSIFKKLNTLKLKEHHFHFSGINFSVREDGLGNERNHEPISVNKPPFKPLAEKILKEKIDSAIICESPLLDRDSLAMKRIFREIGYGF